MAAKTDALATQSPAPQGLSQRPAFIPESNSGLEEMSLKDMILPRLTLCQTNTHQRQKSESSYIKGLEEGMLFNSLTSEIYGDSILVVPLFFYHSRIMFKKMDQGGGIICQAPDGVHCQLNAGGPCLHNTWGAQGEPPECSEFFNYPSLVYRGEGKATHELVIVSLKTTGLAAGKKMNSMMRLRGASSFAGVYKLFSFPDKNKAGVNYFAWDVINGAPEWVDAELYKNAEALSKSVREGLKSGTITAQGPDESDEAFAGRDSEV